MSEKVRLTLYLEKNFKKLLDELYCFLIKEDNKKSYSSIIEDAIYETYTKRHFKGQFHIIAVPIEDVEQIKELEAIRDKFNQKEAESPS
jgi:uncharacterized membrane-anchored protein YjiN (DUF445 family)